MADEVLDANAAQRRYWNTVAGPRWVAAPGFRERRNQESTVDVVPMDGIGDLVVSHLRERAENVEDLAAIEEASCEGEVVVVPKTRGEPPVHTLPDVGKTRNHHRGDRREVRRAAGPNVAVELELAAIGREFGKWQSAHCCPVCRA
jgi:hypothetical protein